jgi:anti-anti-sigma factor
MMTTALYPGLKVEQVGRVTVASITQPSLLEERLITAIGDALGKLVTGHCRRLVVNFRHVLHLSSFMFSQLLHLRKAMRAAGGELVLCELPDGVAKAFERLRFDRLFTICAKEQEALARLQ